jgi:hypothetical protein
VKPRGVVTRENRLDQPFLLIVRTGRIVTAHRSTLRRGCDNERVPPDSRGFQHLARFLSRELPLEGRNVWFTAAVYWGLGSELRLR